ncbi:VanZ family protein [Flavobacterium sp.]|uniref:VanZ family protein n=1 Tax=Flavobacterium sp. TaxID=239 RepID=UPI002FD9F6FE
MTQWKWYLGGYTLLILTIFALAYLKYIPTELNTIPDYDSIGHFVLYGIWGYLFAQTFNKPILSVAKVTVPLGTLLIIPIAITEECLQSLSPVRTFSWFDMGWGLLGITVACLVIHFRTKITH